MYRPIGTRIAHHALRLVVAGLALQACRGKAASSSADPERIGGVVQSVDSQTVVVLTPNGPAHVAVSRTTPVARVVRGDRSLITDGRFLGIGSATQSDGSLRAVEITVFPEQLRGLGEGSYAWSRPDISGGGKMTNGTAGAGKMTNGTVSGSRMTNGTVARQSDGASVTLSYKDGGATGTQTIVVPADVPIVSLQVGGLPDLETGSHVLIFAKNDGHGALTAERVLVGKDGLVPPQ